MPKSKVQKSEDLAELTSKLKEAKSVVLSGYRGTTVKDITKFRSGLRKENIFSKVYKLSLVKKAMKAVGIDGEITDHKMPVILSVSAEDETAPARLIKNFSKDIKTISILEGVVDGKLVKQEMVMVLASLPTKDQLRAQFMSVLNGPISAFARAIKALADKKSEGEKPVAQSQSAENSAAPAAEPPAPAEQANSAAPAAELAAPSVEASAAPAPLEPAAV